MNLKQFLTKVQQDTAPIYAQGDYTVAHLPIGQRKATICYCPVMTQVLKVAPDYVSSPPEVFQIHDVLEEEFGLDHAEITILEKIITLYDGRYLQEGAIDVDGHEGRRRFREAAKQILTGVSHETWDEISEWKKLNEKGAIE